MFGSDEKDHTLRSLPHPGYWDGGREGFYAFATVCLISLLIFGTSDVSWMPTYWKIASTFLIAAPVSYWIGSSTRRKRVGKRAEHAIAYRDAQNAETEKKIAEMQAKNSRIPKVKR
ncbi:hypothetical protein [Actibacterium ureilyticum]|uniref:hypothetical protein n=1 Tax=Actibacterium ureilyticum TaxID=1590614 RepID=UPI000BAAE051|nr:hypothetical protein [Actibacterium ureilyticum]